MARSRQRCGLRIARLQHFADQTLVYRKPPPRTASNEALAHHHSKGESSCTEHLYPKQIKQGASTSLHELLLYDMLRILTQCSPNLSQENPIKVHCL